MNPEITKIIEQYLNGELSESDKLAFEKKMSENELIRREVDFQRQIHEAAKRLSIKQEISSTAKNFHLLRKLIIAGVVTLTLSIATGIYYLVKNNSKQTEISLDEQKELERILNAQAPIDLLPSLYFQWKGKDSVFVSPKGVLISVPKDAFLQNGKVYNDPIIIQYQEAVDVQEIVKSGLSTMSGDQLLETQGMFGLKAFTADKKRLDVNPKVGVYMQIPVNELKTGMMLFEGKEIKNGSIDWQNPKKLQKLPTLANMKDLNFYPPNYEDSLNKMKLRKDKQYRDSLYLSMEEFLGEDDQKLFIDSNQIIEKTKNLDPKQKFKKTILSANRITLGSQTFLVEVEVYHLGRVQFYIDTFNYSKYQKVKFILGHNNFDYSKVKFGNYLNGKKSLELEIEDERIFENGFVSFSLTIPKSEHSSVVSFHLEMKEKGNSKILSQYCSFHLAPSIVKENQEKFKNVAIPPSKVLAFWNAKFENTNLSTRDFEKRMQAIHKTCDPKVLALYTKNLNLSLAEIDGMVVKMGYKEFQKFADENVGKVEVSNKHVENISSYYEKTISDFRKATKSIEKLRLQKEQNWDAETQKQRSDENKRSSERNSKNFKQELEHNTESVYKQLGKKRPEYKNSVGFTITSNVAVYNIDKFVFEQTTSRTSGKFFDQETGKTAKLDYNKMKLKVENRIRYQRVFVYLFPSKLNSFHRLNPENGMFEYSLNAEFQYDLAIVAYKDDGYYFYSKKFVTGADLGTLSLKKVSEEKLNNSLESMNNSRYLKADDISDELKWILREKQDYVVQKKRLNQQQFRLRIKNIVFPCMGMAEIFYPAGDNTESTDLELL
jgi:hypothetical protein